MHQPWASLLVNGIKRIEGRSWSAGDFHGELFIHAAAKPPDPEDVAMVEEQYRVLYALDGVEEVSFPKAYPTSCLLGCVDVVCCLSAAEFSRVPNLSASQRAESEADHVFLCQNPRHLILPRGNMGGDHKIWHLPREETRGIDLGLVASHGAVHTDFRKLLEPGAEKP